MAKAKKKKKIILKHIIKSTKKFHHRKAFFLSALILILIFVYLSSLLLVKGQSKIKYCKIVNSISLKRNVVQKLSVITPYPSITVTPTPAPLTGYCLRVPVLMYHHIQPEATAKQLGQTSLTVDSGMFSQQMAYLATSGYTPIWANELVNALLTHAGLPSCFKAIRLQG